MDEFVTALYAHVEHCEYGGLKEQMIRVRLVVGLRDSKLSERLQLKFGLRSEERSHNSTEQRSFTSATDHCAAINEHSSHFRFGRPSQNGFVKKETWTAPANAKNWTDYN